MIPDLIYDIGAHKGDDTAFYLAKGFRVIAIEANPLMVAELQSRFSAHLHAKQVVIEGCGISDKIGLQDFYAHEHDDWSTFDRNSRFVEGNHRVFTIKTEILDNIVSKHGVPYYIKADIEGGEKHVINCLSRLDSLPSYVSFEDNANTHAQLKILRAIGYNAFKIIEQGSKSGQEVAPMPPLEGNFVPFHFNGLMSGTFGKELPGNWMREDELNVGLEKIRADQANGQWGCWYDVHCRHSKF